MNRRTLLARTGTLATVALAGCVAGGNGDEEGTDGEATDEPTATPTPTATPAPELTDSSFAVTDVVPGDGEGDAEVSFDGDVVVEGAIVGNNGCYSAKLRSAEVVDGVLTVVVAAFDDSGEGEMCTQSLVDVQYEATFTVTGPGPRRVVVRHARGDAVETVADVER